MFIGTDQASGNPGFPDAYRDRATDPTDWTREYDPDHFVPDQVLDVTEGSRNAANVACG
jgi:hypothetical protein